MAHMDIFRTNAFGMVELTAAVNAAPYQPRTLGNMNLFDVKRVRTPSVSVESLDGVLSLIQTSERGAPLEDRKNERRLMRNFNTVRIARGQTIMAHEIDGIRAFGTESELMQVQRAIADVMDGQTGLRSAIELTHENMRLGAVQGIVLDANGDTIINWFTEFGISQPAEVDFDLDNAAPASGAVRTACNGIVRAMKRAAKGAWIDGQTYPVALCGDNFFDNLTAHSEVRATYLNQQEASQLRDAFGMAFESVRYGGIVWINYRGTDDNSTVAIHTDKAKFFPVNAPGAFQVAYSPAEFMPFVGTPGQDIYAMVVTDEERQAWVRPEVYSYPLHICTRPAMLLRAKRT